MTVGRIPGGEDAVLVYLMSERKGEQTDRSCPESSQPKDSDFVMPQKRSDFEF